MVKEKVYQNKLSFKRSKVLIIANGYPPGNGKTL